MTILVVLIGIIIPMGFLFPKESLAMCSIWDTECLKAEQTNNLNGLTQAPSPVTESAVDAGMGSPKGPFDDIASAIRWIWDKVKANLKQAWETSGKIAYKNSLRYFLNKVAYDTATYIATGSPGQKPLFITEGWGEYFQQVGDEAVGDFFYRLGKEVWGKNLCVPWQPLAQVNLTVAAKRATEPQKPVCDWNQIRKNFNDLRDLKFNELVKFSDNFNPASNELGAYLTIRSGALEYKAEKENEENLVRIIEGQFKSVINPISKAVKTPARVVDSTVNTVFNKTFSSAETYTGSPVADAIGTFTNTLVSKYLEKIFKKGFNPAANGGAVVSDIWTLGGRAAAQLFFADLAEVDYKFNINFSTYEFSTEGPGQFNDIIDDKFVQAIEHKCTVGQAAGFYQPGDDAYRGECANLISGTADFGFTQEKNKQPDVSRGIPYRSILALRKFRVVPVGWELAAAYYNQYGDKGERLTLKKLMAAFKPSDVDQPQSPYYQLVDPDWVLKMPLTRCVREGAGSQILPETITFVVCAANAALSEGECPENQRVYSFQRMDYCADYENCIDDTGGRCTQDNWGYCIEEKPVWNIKGTVCVNKYEATCQTLKEETTKKQVSYLLNTVSGADICGQNNVGCRIYCDNKNSPFGKEDWACEVGGDNPERNKILLNNNSKECPASAEGCSLVYSSKDKNQAELEQALDDARAAVDGAYTYLNKKNIKLAPYYYYCKGYNTPVSGIADAETCNGHLSYQEEIDGYVSNYWREDLKICVESGTKECANFTKYCKAGDASCELYTPVSFKGEAVPGRVTKKECADGSDTCGDSGVTAWKDECPAACVGYKNYHQSETQFEKKENNDLDVDFIASTATPCNEPGCDEFTNLDEVAKGGEGKEYYKYLRLCQKPDENNDHQRTYYTWEGSDTSGYQLKKWELLSVSSDNSRPQGETCTDLNNRDCREYFDEELNTYKILYSSTTIITEDCHPYRRTIALEKDCKSINDPGQSQGQWINGQCIYMAVPKENVRCAASNNLCREYKSNQSYNYQKLINSTFALGDLDSWRGGTISRESVRRGDYSLLVTESASHSLKTGDLTLGKTYTVEFLAKKASGGGEVRVGFAGSEEGEVEAVVNLGDNWQFYSINLPESNQGLEIKELTNTDLIISGAGYFDNIVLKKMETTMVIKNSWETPEICASVSAIGSGSEATMIGCEKYKDRNKKEINLRAWTSLCFEEVVGCEPVIKTNNYNNPAEHEVDYLVLDKKWECKKGTKGDDYVGCTKLGLINLSLDESAYTFSDKYKIVLPEEEAPQNFCQTEEVFCEAYTVGDNTYYRKNPNGRLCVFNAKTEPRGWYQLNGEPCPSVADKPEQTESLYYDTHCLGGVKMDIEDLGAFGFKESGECTSNDECSNLASPGAIGLCTNWTGVCSDNSSGCREYQDPQEPIGCSKECVNYANRYIYDNPEEEGILCSSNKICNYYYYKDAETCDQGINPSQGCVGFNQTDNPDKDKRSYRVCTGDTEQPCQNDGDCSEAGGRCVYTNELSSY